MSDRRLIEAAFPLKQASLDSLHEKNVRHGHISTLHIWPARRPLAACRAALIATLLPDPGNEEERRKLCEKIGGRVVKVVKRKKLPNGRIENVESEETVGGILHWGRESSPDIKWFRDKIREAYGGRAPKVLDPFAGGGAIPLEAMRLGCEATAVDINPVAWFILKCTLEYPQKLAGKKLPLPDFVLKDREFMESFFKAQGFKSAALEGQLAKIGLGGKGQSNSLNLDVEDAGLLADLAWQVRAWGTWVLAQARKELARFYPTYAEFEPLDKRGTWEERPMKLVPLAEDCKPDIDSLNAEFDEKYLSDPTNPRWVAKPTVAYLWARTVTCKNCRATIPLLKTRWLCKKDRKRVLLTMEPDAERTGVVFGIQNNVPVVGANASLRKKHDKRIGQGTVTRNGAWCPCCGNPETVAMTTEDIRLEGQAGRLGAMMTAVVVDPIKPRIKRVLGDESAGGKEYRLPTDDEVRLAEEAANEIDRVFADIPFGVPDEPLPGKEALGFRVPLYGFDRWHKLFTPRQLLALGVFLKSARRAGGAAVGHVDWAAAVRSYLALLVDKLADRDSSQCIWISTNAEKPSGSFGRFALPITWDFVEIMPWSDAAGGYLGNLEHIAEFVGHALSAATPFASKAYRRSATEESGDELYDVVFTDPPYYDAIPYSDLMDFFYVWLRRVLYGVSPKFDSVFAGPLSPKWDHEANDGELIDDASRFGGDKAKSRAAYEEGMARAFSVCHQALQEDGRLVIVFANKQPDAWETLVSAIIKAGFVVDGSWPIQTERAGRIRAQTSAALASSVWLVCKKRPETARPGWDKKVLQEMRANITQRLRDFWDAGIRGPDFVWAATGPAMEAYSKCPIVRKADNKDEVVTVAEFLRDVRRIVVDFVVGRVLSPASGEESASGLDDVTTYYLLHRNDFGMDKAPVGPCILYALSCGLSDSDLVSRWDILARAGRQSAEEEEDEDFSEEDPDSEVEETGSGSTVRLKAWNQRRSPNLGLDPASDSARPRADAMQGKLNMGLDAEPRRPRRVPLIDQAHKLMHLWKAGDVEDVDEYLDLCGLRRNDIFARLLQALIELAPQGSEERSILESISNHIQARNEAAPIQQSLAPAADQE